MCLKPCRNPVIFIINCSNEEKPTTALVYWKLLKKQKVFLQLKGFTWLDKSLKLPFYYESELTLNGRQWNRGGRHVKIPV